MGLVQHTVTSYSAEKLQYGVLETPVSIASTVKKQRARDWMYAAA